MAASADTDNSVWACTVCTFENQSNRKLCEMCGNRKPGPKIDDDNGWKCILCTVVNPIEAEACQMCGGPNPLKNDLTGKQLCGTCTSINLANAHSCSICGTPLTNQIIQMDDKTGQLTMVDMSKQNAKHTKNNSNNNNNDNIPQYGNPFADNNINNYQPAFNNGYNNGYNNYYQPPPPQQQYNSHSHNTMPPMPPQQYQSPQPQPQPQQAAMGSIGGMFGGMGMGSWFGGNSNNNNANTNVKHSHSSSKKHKTKKSKRRSHNKYNMSQNYNQDNGSKDIQFKDVSEIFKNDEKDKKRIKQEEEEVKKLSQWYAHIYLTKKKHFDKKIIANIINKMIDLIPDDHWKEVQKIKDKQKEEKTDTNACQVCYCEFDQDEGKLIVMEEHCSHAMICKTCFKQHLKVKIKDDDITPWILCAAPDCKAPISCNLLLKHLELKALYKFAEGFIRKHLARNNNWIRCGTKDCNFGWMILDKSTTKNHKVKCESCNKRQTVCKDPIKQDKGFNELIKNGTLRLCPKCSLPTMKDKGMCNVMHCGKCGIYWNWKTRETGTSSSQLKNKARNNGTLWEPGELAYQQKLQRTNLPEFIKLLEKNGIKYNPNYVRGTR